MTHPSHTLLDDFLRHAGADPIPATTANKRAFMETRVVAGITPTPGTDNHRMLNALIDAAPGIAWNLDYALGLKANSRAADLRKLGWVIEYQSRAREAGGRKRDHGYRLLNPPAQAVAS